MKKLAIISIFFLVLNCTTKKEKKVIVPHPVSSSKKTQQDSISSHKKEVVPSIEKQSIVDTTTYDFEYIKSQSQSLSSKVKVFHRTSRDEKHIPKSFLTKFLSNRKITGGFSKKLPTDYPNSFVFESYKEFSDYNLFTFTYSDEFCCTTLYAATIKKDTLSIINLIAIAYSGGDGGWEGEQYGEWQNDSILKIVSTSDFDNDLLEETNNSEIDTIWSTIKLNKKGLFTQIKNDSVKYVGSKKIN